MPTAINATVSQIVGKKTSKYNNNDREFVNSFNQLLSDEIQSAEETKGGKLTPSEFEGLLNQFTGKVVTERPFFLPDSEDDLSDIPAVHLDEVSNQLRNRGIAVTAENMVKVYNAAVEKGLINE